MSSRPVLLASLGVLILTAFQGCTLPGANLLPQNKVLSCGILKLDPNITEGDYKDKFGAINAVVKSDGSNASSDLSKVSITKLFQADDKTVYAVTTNGGVFNTNNGGRNWKQNSVPDSAVIQDLNYIDSDQAHLYVGGNASNTGKIYAADSSSGLHEVYSDVPGGTTIPFVYISNRNTNDIIAILRSKTSDTIIHSFDNASSWQKLLVLPSKVVDFSYPNKVMNLLLENGTILRQNNEDDTNPTFETVNQIVDFSKQSIKKVMNNSGLEYTLTATSFYRKDGAGVVSKLTLPITDARLWDFDIDPFDASHYIVGIGTRLLETKNSGNTWDVRSDVGSDSNPCAIKVTKFDVFTKGQIYLGRAEDATKK